MEIQLPLINIHLNDSSYLVIHIMPFLVLSLDFHLILKAVNRFHIQFTSNLTFKSLSLPNEVHSLITPYIPIDSRLNVSITHPVFPWQYRVLQSIFRHASGNPFHVASTGTTHNLLLYRVASTHTQVFLMKRHNRPRILPVQVESSIPGQLSAYA